MKFSNEIKAVIGIFIVLLIAVMVTNSWHSFGLRPAFAEMELISFDNKAVEKSCFELKLTPNNFFQESYRNYSVIVNDKIIHDKEIDVSKNQEIKECVGSEYLKDGDNTVFINLGEDRLFYHTEKGDKKENYFVSTHNQNTPNQDGSFKSNLILGMIIISILLIVLFFGAFQKSELIERTAFTGTSFFVLISVPAFLLLALNIFSIELFFGLLIILTALIAFRFKNNFGKTVLKMVKPIPFELVLLGFILFASLGFHFFTENNVSYWTSYYERQGNNLADSMNLPFNDQYSELGTKPYSYTGYFFINSGMQWLLNIPANNLFPITTLLAGLMLLASLIYFFREIGIEKKVSYLAILLLFMSGFIFGDIVFNIRHSIGYSFMILALALLIKGKKWLPGLFLGFAGFVQPPLVVLFFLASVVLFRTKKLTATIRETILAGLITALFYLPTFLRHGLITQAKSNIWGYNFGMPFPGVILDLLAILLFSLFFLVPMIYSKKIKIDSDSQKLIAGIIVLMVIQSFITYRVNIITALVFSVLIARLFPVKLLEKDFVQHALSILLIFGLATTFTTMTFFSTPITELAVADYVKENTSYEANFLVEPSLGHSIIYLTERKVLSDLAVEYASGEKIDDSFNFLKTKNLDILDKYDIQYVINRSIFIDEKPVGGNIQPRKIEFENMNKIYSNSVFYVHEVVK